MPEIGSSCRLCDKVFDSVYWGKNTMNHFFEEHLDILYTLESGKELVRIVQTYFIKEPEK